MLDMIDKNKIDKLAPVITVLFDSVSILKLYWKVMKLNIQSLHIMRVANEGINILVVEMVKLSRKQIMGILKVSIG